MLRLIPNRFSRALGRCASLTGSRLPWLALSVALLATASLSGCGGGNVRTASTGPADQVVVYKAARRLELWKNGAMIADYHVSLGKSPIGHKFREGDGRTPVGEYVLDWRNANSNYHKAIHVSYPNGRDRLTARALGYRPGGMIMIHGQPNGIRSPNILSEYTRIDWTNGCIALSNTDMDKVWRMVPDGTPIRILP